MIAGGSGITPMLQIVFKNENEQTTVKLLFANRTEADILLREEIEDFKRQFPGRFSFMYTVDRPGEGWQYESGFINQVTRGGSSLTCFLLFRIWSRPICRYRAKKRWF